jgi:DNA-directed RNA polymerase subunit RPC12/RpoP
MNTNVSLKRYAFYLLRWQLSTPVMLPVTLYFGATVMGVFMANLIGGLIFFWVDKFIFSSDRTDLPKKYLFYLGRWQLTSITLYPCLLLFGSGVYGVVAGNFIGGLIFFWVDKYIFANKIVPTYWEIREKATCSDCGKIGRGFRVVKAKNYDKSKDKNPEYRCDDCSKKKLEELKLKGVEVTC